MKNLINSLKAPSTWATAAIVGLVILISMFVIGQTESGAEMWAPVVVTFGSFSLWIATRKL